MAKSFCYFFSIFQQLLTCHSIWEAILKCISTKVGRQIREVLHRFTYKVFPLRDSFLLKATHWCSVELMRQRPALPQLSTEWLLRARLTPPPFNSRLWQVVLFPENKSLYTLLLVQWLPHWDIFIVVKVVVRKSYLDDKTSQWFSCIIFCPERGRDKGTYQLTA